jgi:hypothetical protein
VYYFLIDHGLINQSKKMELESCPISSSLALIQIFPFFHSIVAMNFVTYIDLETNYRKEFLVYFERKILD